MSVFKVPARSEVNETSQNIFDGLQKQVGMVPNLYATFALSETALATYVQLQSVKTSLSNKEKEIVNLVVSQVNNCRYCQSAHTAIGKMNGFTDEQIIEIRNVAISFNPKFQALAEFVKDVAINRGRPSQTSLTAFFAAGYTQANLVDVIVQIGDKIMANYLHNITQIPIDFPVAVELPSLETAAV